MQRIVYSRGGNSDVSVSPDGSKITLMSTRTGKNEIWMADADGGNQPQLTFLDGAHVGSPRWSSDAAVSCSMGALAALPTCVPYLWTAGPSTNSRAPTSTEVRPSYSWDGKWIYFASEESGRNEIWKMPAEGGKAIQVTRNGGTEPFESPGGQWIYLAKQTPGLWRIKPDGAGEQKIADNVVVSLCAVGREHVHYVDGRKLFRMPLPGGAPSAIYESDEQTRPTQGPTSIAVPPDESFIITTPPPEGEPALFPVENFR